MALYSLTLVRAVLLAKRLAETLPQNLLPADRLEEYMNLHSVDHSQETLATLHPGAHRPDYEPHSTLARKVELDWVVGDQYC